MKGAQAQGWLALFACCLLPLIAIACGQGGKDGACASDSVGRRNLRGHYMVSSEHWLFQACGSNAALWVDPYSLPEAKGGSLLGEAQRAVCAERDGGSAGCGERELLTIFVDIVADVSPLGVYGQSGQLGQELKVIEVLSASPTSPSDCPQLDTVFTPPRPDCLR